MKTRHVMRRSAYSKDFALVMRTVLAALLIVGLISNAHAAPEGGIVRAGSAQIIEQGSKTQIRQSSQRAIVDWRGFNINSDEWVQFAQPSVRSATLNRVTGDGISSILGRMDANGQVLLVNPNGIIFGNGARINVGSFIASTANINNDNFMQGNLVFDQPGRPGAEIINAGTITAAEGGLIALVAPHVRNDGLIQARLGKVVLGAADTFTIDLYGDGLVNLALSEDSLAEMKDAQGQPLKDLLSQAGIINVSGGQAVLVTAEVAQGVLDNLINMSGTIRADSAVQEGGSILLLARGGNVDVSGSLSAQGTTGGQIDVLGDQVHLFSSAMLDVNGIYGGGALHVGGDYRGSGNAYRAQSTYIDHGALLHASAQTRGNGGEVVVWSNGETFYDGSIFARGGAETGNGGLVEVSSKQTLFFNGLVDAGASCGNSGSLLLDPYNFTIGMVEAGLINRVLRTGASTSVSADNNLYLNYTIDGRGRYAGGGLTLTAGNNLNVNDNILTNNGAINLLAEAGSVTVASGKVIYAGTSPITVRSGGTLTNAFYLTDDSLSLISTLGSININQGIDSSIGNLLIEAEEDVNINYPIISLNDGDTVNISAGNDINVDAQIDGRPTASSDPNGSVTMNAGQDINLNKSILANEINLTASLGTIAAPTMTAGTVAIQPDGIPLGEGLFAGTGSIAVTAGDDLSNGVYVTTGPVSIRSTGGDVTVDTKLAEILGNVTIVSDTGSVTIDQEIANIRSGSNLTVTAGTDINLNRQIDALDDTNPLSITPVSGGSLTFTAANDINLNKDLGTYNGPVDMTATTGTLNIAWNNTDNRTYRIQAGTAPITVTTGENLSTGIAPPASLPWDDAWMAGLTIEEQEQFPYDYVDDQLKHYVTFSTNGKLSLTSTGGDVTVDAPIPNSTGEVALSAADAIIVNHKVLSNNQAITLTAGPGGITINGTNDDYGISFIGGQSPSVSAGSGDLTIRAVGDVSIGSNGIATGGKLTIDTRSKILQGCINNSAPSEIELIADEGINSFYAGYSPTISATSIYGDIHLGVWKPGQLSIDATQGSAFTGGYLGPDVTIHAGMDIDLTGVYESGTLRLTAGRNVDLDFLDIFSLEVTASNNITFSNPQGESYPTATVWLNGGDMIATSTGGNIAFGSDTDYSAIHIDNEKSLVLDANGSVEVGILETLGAVSITAQTGDITLRNDIGPPVQFYNPDIDMYYSPYNAILDASFPIYWDKELNDPSFDPTGIGVASLLLNAGGDIVMEGAKAAGTVTITAGGTLTPAKGIYSGTTGGVNITTSNVTITSADSYGSIPLDTQAELVKPFPVLPAIAAGPTVGQPGIPTALTALPAQAPDVASVTGSDIPGASDTGMPEQEIQPERAAGTGGLSEIIPEEEEDAEEEESKKILKFSGGRGVNQEADFGQR